MIKFRCASCGQKLGVPDDFAGRLVKCTGCASPARVPGEVVKPPRASAPPPPPPLDDLETLDDLEEVDDFETLDDAAEGDDGLTLLEEEADDGLTLLEDEGEQELKNVDSSRPEEIELDSDPIAALAQFDTAPTPQANQPPPQFAQARPGNTPPPSFATSPPPQGGSGGNKQWMLTCAHISFWAADLPLIMVCCLSRVVGGADTTLGMVNWVVAAFVAPLVAIVCGIIGIAGAKHFPGRGAMWRSIVGVVAGSFFLLAGIALTVVGFAAMSMFNSASTQIQQQQRQDQIALVGTYEGKWSQGPADFSGKLVLNADQTYTLTITSGGSSTVEEGGWQTILGMVSLRPKDASTPDGFSNDPDKIDTLMYDEDDGRLRSSRTSMVLRSTSAKRSSGTAPQPSGDDDGVSEGR